MDQNVPKDFLAACTRLWMSGVTFDDLRSILPLIEKADTPGGERDAVEALAAKATFLSEPSVQDIARGIAADVVRELCNYSPEARGDVLEAAEALADSEADTIQKLQNLRAAVLAEFQRLDDRTRAILTVLEELRAAGRNVTDARFCDIPDELGPVSVDVLRSEPGLTAAIRAYDLARIALNHHEDIQLRRP
jgi:hypothetical protein